MITECFPGPLLTLVDRPCISVYIYISESVWLFTSLPTPRTPNNSLSICVCNVIFHSSPDEELETIEVHGWGKKNMNPIMGKVHIISVHTALVRTQCLINMILPQRINYDSCWQKYDCLSIKNRIWPIKTQAQCISRAVIPGFGGGTKDLFSVHYLLSIPPEPRPPSPLPRISAVSAPILAFFFPNCRMQPGWLFWNEHHNNCS